MLYKTLHYITIITDLYNIFICQKIIRYLLNSTTNIVDRILTIKLYL